MIPPPAFSLLNYQHVAALKALLALLAAALLVWWWLDERRSQPRNRKPRKIALVVIGVLSLTGWWNFGRFHFSGGYIHYHEFFHYYLGSKYLPELGYIGLYDCVAAVEVEQGRAAEVSARWIRDLGTNDLRRGSPNLEQAYLCRARFLSSARWLEFTHDVGWFREYMNDQKWIDVLTDHGYNATPIWSVAGNLLSSTGPVSSNQIFWLAALDPALLAVMAALVWWAFGWQVLCVTLVWLGTNYPARYNFVGGAFVRQDWLLLSIAGICFAKRGVMWASGFALTWSALQRVFPVFIMLGLALKIATRVWRSRSLRFAPDHVRFAGGVLVALAVLLPISFTVGGEEHGGAAAWRDFAENSQKHLSTPLTNHIGLPVVVSFDPSSRAREVKQYWLDSPWDVWKEARRRTFARRLAFYGALVVAFGLLLAAAVRSQQDWTALVLGIGTIPISTELTSYYYSILLGFALLWPRYQFVGIGLALTSFACGVTPAMLREDDERYTAISGIMVLFVIGATALIALSRSTERRSAVPQALVPVEDRRRGHAAVQEGDGTESSPARL